MVIAVKLKSYLFTAGTEQEAYIKGCKKLAYLIASKKYSNLSVKVERVKGNLSTFKFTIYANIDSKTEQKNFCKACKEYHSSFFINENYNCSRCNLRSFLERSENKLKDIKGFYKDKVKE